MKAFRETLVIFEGEFSVQVMAAANFSFPGLVRRI
jgi:hypothetical protein